MDHEGRWLGIFQFDREKSAHLEKMTKSKAAKKWVWKVVFRSFGKRRIGGQPLVSRPKPDTWIYDHDRHANIKPKPNINKNQLNFMKTFTQKLSSFFSS